MRSRPMLLLWSVTICTGACDGSSWLDDPTMPFPSRLSDTAVFSDPEARSGHQRAITYDPQYPLWSNGTEKERLLILPDEEQIEAVEGPEHDPRWRVPDGSVLVKTFVAEGRPVETRLIVVSSDGPLYAAYRWRENGMDADLLDGSVPVEVEVEVDGERVMHSIPSQRQCRICHESSPDPWLGLSELQLGSQLAALDAEGVLDFEPPPSPVQIEGPSAEDTAILAYLHGNCAHCHNGLSGPSTSFDLSHPVALANMINRTTESEAAEPGVRVIPGNASESVLFRAVSGESGMTMPPVGVQRRDQAFIERLRAWIDALE